jgi:MoaA/NifB/PqqE/SkfB family radical SAM enzyme
MFMDHVALLREKVVKPTARFGELALHPSDVCQLGCSFCELPLVKATMDPAILAAAMAGEPLNVIVVGGGEPTAAPRRTLLELARALKGREAKLITNGVRIPGEFYEVGFPFDHVRVSLNAGTPETYQSLTGRDSFGKVLDNITEYLESPVPHVGIGYVMTTSTIAEVPAVPVAVLRAVLP